MSTALHNTGAHPGCKRQKESLRFYKVSHKLFFHWIVVQDLKNRKEGIPTQSVIVDLIFLSGTSGNFKV